MEKFRRSAFGHEKDQTLPGELVQDEVISVLISGMGSSNLRVAER